MPGHHARELNKGLWADFVKRIPKIWAVYKKLRQKYTDDQIEVVLRPRPPTPATEA